MSGGITINTSSTNCLVFDNNINDNKIILYTGYGFGINDFTLRYNAVGNHKFYNNGVETFDIDGNGNISVPGDLNITGVINKSSAGFLIVYNASGFLDPLFIIIWIPFYQLIILILISYMYYIYDNLGNIYSGQFLTTRIVPYTMRIITGIAHAASTTFIIISAGLDTAVPPNCWFYTKGSATNAVVYLKIKQRNNSR